MANTVATQATLHNAPLHARGESWDAAVYDGRLHYRDAAGKLNLPLPRMTGAHQADNAALAIAMLRHQSAKTGLLTCRVERGYEVARTSSAHSRPLWPTQKQTRLLK